ncbi:MAG TPA: YhjD/YihY/BrkB family envelope integrity protein [Pseudonocardia sp.]|jgi:membrane protein|nr:YhjD/YihY/BrkB family envelope integrity protein [Pseudonocardia sp.]
MCTRYLTHRGYQQAAAITYFSVLSLVPVLMVVLSVAGYLLAGQPWVLGRLHHASQQAVPVALQPVVADGVDSAIDHRFGLGLAGILFAAYSGWNWINALRDALTGMWRLRRIDAPVITTIAEDCLALLGLGLALVVTFAVSAVGSGLGRRLLGLAGVDGTWLASTALSAGSVFVGVAASWLVFWWVLAELPRVAVSRRAARAPALIVAMAFEVLKQLVNLYLQALGRSPIGVTLGSVVGVLVFAYLVSRLLLLAAAWIATAPSPRRLAESRRGDPRRATVPTPRRSPEAVTVDRSAFMIYRSADPGDPRRAD